MRTVDDSVPGLRLAGSRVGVKGFSTVRVWVNMHSVSEIPYTAPSVDGSSYNCPLCRAFAKQERKQLLWAGISTDYCGVRCQHCGKIAVWLDDSLIWPHEVSAPLAHSEMPADCKIDYEEARQVLAVSPRSSAALLRLVIQKLMKHLGQPGEKINDDIAALVKAGLPSKIQKALDVCRITGNESVHPGSMDLSATPDVALALFGLVNLVVDNQIAEPKRIDALYNSLPADKIAGVEKRDGKKS